MVGYFMHYCGNHICLHFVLHIIFRNCHRFILMSMVGQFMNYQGSLICLHFNPFM